MHKSENNLQFNRLAVLPGRSYDLNNYLYHCHLDSSYQSDFKIFNTYQNTYKKRLELFIDSFNGHVKEIDFIKNERNSLENLQLFSFVTPFKPEHDNEEEFEWEIMGNNIFETVCEEYYELIRKTWFILQVEQIQIAEYLDKLATLITDKDDDISSNNEFISAENTITYRLKVLHTTGILQFLKEKYVPKNSDSYEKLLKMILNLDKGDLKSPTQDFFGNAELTNKKDFRRSNKGYDEIEQFLDQHFSKHPKNK
jgi:hypothetical protein